jgi:hypothetical protein
MKSEKSYIIDLVQQIRMDISPVNTFEQLDKFGITFRAQNEIVNLAETTNQSGWQIANYIMAQPYFYRYTKDVKTVYVHGVGYVSEELYSSVMRSL